ncbi:4-hydroxy-tetrahydrodipicolinate synthase [Sphingobium boeckii]|uniref:4-hydroxy-tetrahydrodipicolinate synthase n=2 Tax=Sphingobium boeckii TaxID=1082345 RepID=A0A7W9AKV4_9SPHN|nr:4-hydroxy-tetrahydrodipicolinate synthase [Sphingobium boeckii]
MVDEPAFRSFIDWQIDQGSKGLVPCGTTGESATMSIEEHNAVVVMTIDQAAGRVPVIAGCGSNDTMTALAHMKSAQAHGATAALVVAPYYNKPNFEGVYAHFAYLADHCDLPMILYNVPSRTITDIGPETMGRLAEIPSIIGVKDASGNAVRVTAQRLACGQDFVQLSGNDDMALGFMAMGGVGCISVTANVAPRLCADFQSACASGDWDIALELQDRLFPLHTALFSDASPGPLKYALHRMRPDFLPDVRLPMTQPRPPSRVQVDAALESLGLV